MYTHICIYVYVCTHIYVYMYMYVCMYQRGPQRSISYDFTLGNRPREAK